VCIHLSLLSEGQRRPRVKVTNNINSQLDENDNNDFDGEKSKTTWKDFSITNQQCERDILAALNTDLNVFLPLRYLHQYVIYFLYWYYFKDFLVILVSQNRFVFKHFFSYMI
jgi:hypothetical protein